MGSIIGKTIKGQTYYYLREIARVDGKPKVVSQTYLGKAADIEAALKGATSMPDRTRHLAFGDVAAVWEMLRRLRVAEIVGARRSDAGGSVGTYIALATLNRVVDPCSKLAFSQWWSKTACDRWLRLGPGALDHRRFWEAMDAIGADDLEKVERRIVSAMVETFSIIRPTAVDVSIPWSKTTRSTSLAWRSLDRAIRCSRERPRRSSLVTTS